MPANSAPRVESNHSAVRSGSIASVRASRVELPSASRRRDSTRLDDCTVSVKHEERGDPSAERSANPTRGLPSRTAGSSCRCTRHSGCEASRETCCCRAARPVAVGRRPDFLVHSTALCTPLSHINNTMYCTCTLQYSSSSVLIERLRPSKYHVLTIDESRAEQRSSADRNTYETKVTS